MKAKNPYHGCIFSAEQLNRFYQYAMMLCQQRDDAYDLLQASLEKYLSVAAKKQSAIKKPEAFMHTLIHNRYIDYYRYQQRWASESFEEEASYDISPLDLEQLTIDSQMLQDIWKNLSASERNILYSWAVLGDSTDEACRRLGMARGTFLSRIHRLRKKLKAS